MAKRKICKCGKPSLPGLRKDVALCQYHFNVRIFGKKWADQVEASKSAK